MLLPAIAHQVHRDNGVGQTLQVKRNAHLVRGRAAKVVVQRELRHAVYLVRVGRVA